MTPPGLALPAQEHAAFITSDCIAVAEPSYLGALRMSDGEDDEPGEHGNNLALQLSWEEIMRLWDNQALQRAGWDLFKPANYDSARGCEQCGRPALAMAWIYFRNDPDCWLAECGLEGWIVTCPHCRKQTDFVPTLMS